MSQEGRGRAVKREVVLTGGRQWQSCWPVPVSFLRAAALSGSPSSLTVNYSSLEPWRKLQDRSEKLLWMQKGEMHACMMPE